MWVDQILYYFSSVFVMAEVDDGIRHMLGIEIPSQNGYYSDDRIMLRSLKRAYDPSVPVDDRPNIIYDPLNTSQYVWV